LVKRSEDGNVNVTGDYIGPISGKYEIYPLKFVAVAAGSDGSSGGGCATGSYAFLVLLIVLPLLLMRRRDQAV
jgi:Synergist-CTERM protein sorting domain-containing protein